MVNKLKICNINSLKKMAKEENEKATTNAIIAGSFLAGSFTLVSAVTRSEQTDLTRFLVFLLANYMGIFSVYKIKKMIESLLKKHSYEEEIRHNDEEKEKLSK